METLAEFIQRLLEIQSGEKQRSPALIAEKRLNDGLQGCGGSLPRTVKLGRKSRVRERPKAYLVSP